MVQSRFLSGLRSLLSRARYSNLILATPGDGRKISQTIVSHALQQSLTIETHLVVVCRDQSSLNSFIHVCGIEEVNSSSKLHIHRFLLESKSERESFFVHWEKEFLRRNVSRIQFLLAGGAQEVLLNTYENTRKMKSLRETQVQLLLGDELDEAYYPDGYTHERWSLLHQDMIEKNKDSESYRIQFENL